MPDAWGDWKERSITWETLTSTMLIESGADIVVLRHPETVKRTRTAIDDLMTAEQAVLQYRDYVQCRLLVSG